MKLYICNIKDADGHCVNHCFHGKPHDKKDLECLTAGEYCDIVGKRIKCRKLYKKELKALGL